MAGVEVEGLGKRFGAHAVMADLSLGVRDGEFVALVGPSGCGKSTLLRLVAGLEEASEGTIRIGGRDVTDLAPKDRDIAMVFQSYALYPHMTVAENMGFALRLRRRPAAEAEAAVARAAGILGLGDLLGRYPRQLSGGQRQRVAMGRAIVRDPSVFLFDEPLSNLDAKLRVQMRAEIKDLHRRLGTTTIYVTHDQVEAMTMADRVVVMRGGRIEQAGAPLDLYDHPANTFVAGFIGSPAMNLLPGGPAEGGFRTAAGLLVPGPSAPGAAWLGVRPEHLRLDPEGVDLEVAVVEPLGAETQVVLRHGEDRVVALLRQRLAVRPGDRLRLSPEPGALHLFDGEGRRLEPA